MAKKSSGKQAWISKKIAILHKEGYGGDQAVAIAENMWREQQKKKRKK